MRALLLGAIAAGLAASGLAAAPVAASSGQTGQPVTGIIVAYEPGVAATASGRDIGFGMRVVDLPEAVPADVAEGIADRMAGQPGVRFAEPNTIVQLADTQPSPTWGLDRVDERALPLNGSYGYGSTGDGVTAYVIDTGLRATHTEFTGRVGGGFVATGIGADTTDCNGHGTHVAGTIAGSTYGVAKEATIVPVRVFGCSDTTTLDAVIAGISWVVDDHGSGPAVANMSLTSGANDAVDTAVAAMIADGITVVAASGNAAESSCLSSPSRMPAVITVNASDSADAAASFSNFGSCSDLYAPGVDITSAGILSDTDTATMSGTSMAAPHVAGMAARLLQRDPALTPAQVHGAVVSLATPVTFGPASPDPDLLLFAPQPPSAPQDVSVNPVGTTVEVAWQAPSVPTSDGGSALTEYQATAWSLASGGTSAGTCTPSPASALSCTIEGLTVDSTYYIDVAAGNAVSASTSSSPRISTTLTPSVPSAPQSVTATAGNGTATVSWLAPSNLGGSAVSAYDATAWTAASGGSSAATCQPSPVDTRACTLTGLTNGTAYYVDVTATNATGTGTASSPRVAVTPTAPAPPPSGGGGSSGGSSSSGETGGGGGGSIWTVVEVRPAFGSTAGGDTVLVLGWGFTGATGVSVGGTMAPGFRFINDATLEITTPPGTLGWQELRVWLPNGSVPAMFEYREVPSPPASTAGEVSESTPTATPEPVTVVRTLARPPTRTAKGAPAVRATVDVPVRVRVAGLPRSTRATVQARVDGRYVRVGTVRTTATGRALLPAFTPPETGAYLVRVTPTGKRPLYLKVVAR